MIKALKLGILHYALYKLTTYLLTYLRTCLRMAIFDLLSRHN